MEDTTYSWKVISDYVHMSLILEDKEKEKKVKEGFSKFWQRLAREYIKQDFTDEYNSIKHGLRIKSGGFSLAIGKEDVPGKPAPPEKMNLVGRSQYGSTYNVIKNIGETKNHLQVMKSSRNWSPIDITWALHIISMSITNIINALKILNGDDATAVKFSWPSDLDTFEEPWKRSKKLGVTSMTNFGVIIHPELITEFEKSEINSFYCTDKDAGIIRKVLNSDGESPAS